MDESRAMSYCLWLLGRRAYTAAELRERLGRREVDPDVISGVLDRLRGWGYVDDAEFSRQFVRSRQGRYGKLRLRAELRHRGVTEETAEEGLGLLTDNSQLEAARSLLERNAWRFRRSADPQRDRARAWAFLARRGFPPPVVSEALEGFPVGRDPDPASRD